ncbi:4Fe-4S binding protein [candidate division KSB1 bacterium]|nr:4Fe-4S binding protein [candidate division KSB1 bacterium]
MKIFVFTGALILVIVLSSLMITAFWGGKAEKIPEKPVLIFRDDMTVAEFGAQNNLPDSLLKKIFGLQTQQNQQSKLSDHGLSHEEISTKIDQNLALIAESESKNWIKIRIKFALWFAFLIFILILVIKAKITAANRKWFYVAALIIFGILLGSDPSPMGTVKDAIVLFGSKRVIFPPRMIALGAFLLMVIFANKFICSWGCQLGALQDLIFRFNRNAADTKGIIKQYKIPFVISNSIRILFFVVFTAIAFLFATDIVELIDPFKIYNPVHIGLAGGIFIVALILTSVFVYRPWCHLFCPFGLVGWFLEKISLFKINVNYETCIACNKCAQACPSTVMEAILKRERIIPDCFACANCIETCPTDSIQLSRRRREKPPKGKFKSKQS